MKVLGLTTLVGLSLFVSGSAKAADLSKFSAGNIISNAVFFNNAAMSASQIQTFLNSKVSVCDTNGEKPYTGSLYAPDYNGDGIIERWERGQYAGSPKPYTCLKDYSQSTPAMAAVSGLCNNVLAKSSNSAANIIKDVSDACGVNPKVLIVLLQKEQGLVTDDWPWPAQYTKATGFGCPDTATCDPAYKGFFYQVYSAAYQFKKYQANPNNYNYVAGQNNTIFYHPGPYDKAHNKYYGNAYYVYDSTLGKNVIKYGDQYAKPDYSNSAPDIYYCGSKSIYIQNQATAGLYNYTPYIPNQAALDAGYGTGDTCSSYGNRNFYSYFVDWFGSTQTNISYDWLLVSKTVYADSGHTRALAGGVQHLAPGQKAYIEVKAYNNGTQSWDPSFVRIGTSSPNDRTSAFYDSSWINTSRPAAVAAVTPPGSVGTFDFTITAPSSLSINEEHFNLVAEGRTWMKDLGLKFYLDINNPISPVATHYQLQPGDKLIPGQALLSKDTKSVFELQQDGNAVVYKDFLAVWNSGTNYSNSKVGRLEMQADGNLVIYSPEGKALWNSKTYNNPGAFLEMQTDGNLVIYNSSRTAALWNTKTGSRPDGLSYVDTRMFSGSHMVAGQSLVSPDSKFRLSAQTDGNLVLYNSAGLALWNSHTPQQVGNFLNYQPDGNLVLYAATGKPLWHTHTAHTSPGQLLMQPDGNLVLYDSAVKPIWKSDTVQKTLLATSTNSRQSNQSLTVGQSITSTNGSYHLILQADGNLVLYNSANKALWSSRTNDKPVSTVNMQPDGNFVAYDTAGHHYWDTHTNNHPGSIVMLQDNGQLVIYDAYSHNLWSAP